MSACRPGAQSGPQPWGGELGDCRPRNFQKYFGSANIFFSCRYLPPENFCWLRPCI